MIHLPRCCAAVTSLAAGERSKRVLTFVHVRQLADARWRVEATDGRALGVLHGPSSPTPEDLDAALALPTPERLAAEALLPAAEIRRAFESLPKGRRGCDRTLGVLLARPQTMLVAGGTVARCACEDGRFPDVDGVLPKGPALVSIRIDPELLAGLLRAAGAVAKTGERPGVELLWWGKDRPLGVACRGAAGVCFDGLLMPLT